MLKVTERCTAELHVPRVSVNACQFGVGFALSSSVVVSFSPEWRRLGMGIKELLESRRDEILDLAGIYGAKNIRVFGSAARGEGGPASDVDLLVDMEKGRNLLDLVGFWQDLEELLGCRVDVITDGGISPYLRERIYAEAIPL